MKYGFHFLWTPSMHSPPLPTASTGPIVAVVVILLVLVTAGIIAAVVLGIFFWRRYACGLGYSTHSFMHTLIYVYACGRAHTHMCPNAHKQKSAPSWKQRWGSVFPACSRIPNIPINTLLFPSLCPGRRKVNHTDHLLLPARLCSSPRLLLQGTITSMLAIWKIMLLPTSPMRRMTMQLSISRAVT